MERVQKMLAAAGVSSRRGAEELIKAGRVTVNGEVVELGARVDPARDTVAVDGTPVHLPTHRTIMLHKPAGIVTSRKDPHATDTVMSLVPAIPGLHPVGRLDMNTTGLLLLTNDGELTFALTHPRHVVDKTYRAWVRGIPSNDALHKLREGITLEDGPTAPAQVRRILTRADRTLVEMTIHEGRKRQVRRMLEAVESPVISLARVRLGPLTLGDLPEGQWRDLNDEELDALYKAAGVRRT
ncbi:MAG: pseudouridine synthase [Armatimonadota bacterium]